MGVIYFAHTHAYKRDREGGKRRVGASCFAHTQACGLVLLGTIQNVWVDPLTPTRVAVIETLTLYSVSIYLDLNWVGQVRAVKSIESQVRILVAPAFAFCHLFRPAVKLHGPAQSSCPCASGHQFDAKSVQ